MIVVGVVLLIKSHRSLVLQFPVLKHKVSLTENMQKLTFTEKD